jgi:serine/threonine protein kinase
MTKFCKDGHQMDDSWTDCPYCVPEDYRVDLMDMGKTNPSLSNKDDPEEQVTIPLPKSFRFIHEPIDQGALDYFVGRQQQLDALLDRMTFSRGGAFLVTGYRGVGKTSFTNQLLHEFERRCKGSKVITIPINLARALAPAELMFLIVRCLYLQFAQPGVEREILSPVIKDLKLAYSRTLMTIKDSRSSGYEYSLTGPGLEAEGGGTKAKVSAMLGVRRTRSQGGETTYLTYEERAAEFDLIQLSRRLLCSWCGPVSWWSRLLPASRKRPGDLRIVFVLDELDKIDDPQNLDELFSALKNLLTTSGLTFLLVAGKDTQERWGLDVGRGESIYESVFASEVYLPCMWDQTEQLCSRGIETSIRDHDELKTLWSALAFKGRGIPRRILGNFHDFVRWHDGIPLLLVTTYENRDAKFYAGLEGVLSSLRAQVSDGNDHGNDAESDKRALGLYYLVDWILNRGTEEFSLADAIAAYEALNPKLIFERTMAGHIEELLTRLESSAYIQSMGRVEEKQFVRSKEASIKRYRLMRTVRPADAGHAAVSPPSFGDYKTLGPIAEGGIGRVVRALDKEKETVVAVKYVHKPSRQVRSLFEAEAEALKSLSIEGIPWYYASEVSGNTPWIAMEFIEAPSLREILICRGKIPETEASRTGMYIAKICSRLHECRYVHGDLKPSNVLVNAAGQVVLIDFSTARVVDAPAGPFGTAGTPAYMAPELLRGEAMSSPGSDIYALGILLYEIVCGWRPFIAGSPEQLVGRIKKGAFQKPSSLPNINISTGFEKIILRCIKVNPEDRWASMEEVRQAISSLLPGHFYEDPDEEAGGLSAHREDLQSQATVEKNRKPVSSGSIDAAVAIGVNPAPAAFAVSSPAPPIEWPLEGSKQKIDDVWFETFINSKSFPDSDRSPIGIHPIRASLIQIGRDADADIHIDDPELSRTHAIVTLQDDQYCITDMGSLNGTMINGSKLAPRIRVVLKDGDRVEIGKWVLVFRSRFFPSI